MHESFCACLLIKLCEMHGISCVIAKNVVYLRGFFGNQ